MSIDEDEKIYREMNEEDDFYMGDKDMKKKRPVNSNNALSQETFD